MPISRHHAQVFYLPELPRPATLSDNAGLWFEAGEGQVHQIPARR
jgi:hypothetical protein